MSDSPDPPVHPEPRLSAWEDRTDWPLTALAVAFLAAYAVQVLDTDAPPGMHLALEIVLWATWAIFAADYVIRLILARRKGHFVLHHLFDLLAVALPMLRQLRVLRVVTVLRVLNRHASSALRGKVGLYVATITILVSLSAALAVLDAERSSPDASIKSFPEALWWTLTTISTVGYGDLYPTTWEGRLVAASLMIGGIALLGVITAMIASWLLEKIRATEDNLENTLYQESMVLRSEMDRLRTEITRLNAELAGQRRADATCPPGPRPKT